MNQTERRQAVGALYATLDALLASGGDRAGQTGAELRRLIGELRAQATDRVEAGDFGTPLRACFRAATTAGATFDGMCAVQSAAASVTTDRPAVVRVTQTSIRFALVEMSLILAATTFASRSDAEAALAQINLVYQPAEDFAADRNSDVWRALVALHAATVRDLTQRAKQLPRIVSYVVPRRLPALTLSSRLYGDGSRFEELAAENRAVHPLFMPSAGRALAL